MENQEALYVFEPGIQVELWTLFLGLLVALAAGALTYLLQRKKVGGALDRNRRLLLAMLTFFALLIGLGISFFSAWNLRRTSEVRIYPESIETGYGKLMYENLEEAIILRESQPSLINPNLNRQTKRFLVLRAKEGRDHVLSEDNYPIEEILRALREVE